MANIQAALNSMLSSAAGMGFVATQTPGYKKRQEIKGLEKTITAQERAANAIQEAIEEGEVKPGEPTPAGERQRLINLGKLSDQLAEEAIPANTRLLQLTGKKKYLNAAIQEMGSGKGELEKEFRDQFALEDKQFNKENKINAKVINNQKNKINTTYQQLQAMAARKDIFSAKERGQLETMIGRHKEALTNGNEK